MKRHLPLVVEKSLGTLKKLRVESASAFERQLTQTLIDQDLKFSCKSGCSNCCYHPVLITALEGILVYRWLLAHGRWSNQLQSTLRAHADKTRDLPFNLWFLSVIPCPLLDTKTQKCTAYAGRPEVCRLTFSIGNPDNCHPHRIADAGLLNKQKALEIYHQGQANLTEKHRMSMMLLPLSLAILIGARVDQGEIGLEEVDFAILKEYVR